MVLPIACFIFFFFYPLLSVVSFFITLLSFYFIFKHVLKEKSLVQKKKGQPVGFVILSLIYNSFQVDEAHFRVVRRGTSKNV